jgi:hypothetical protein
MRPSREFKESVLIVGFFLLSVAVLLILLLGISGWGWRRPAPRSLPLPAAEQLGQ